MKNWCARARSGDHRSQGVADKHAGAGELANGNRAHLWHTCGVFHRHHRRLARHGDDDRPATGGRFGDQVIVEYFDLFGPEMDRFPAVLAAVSQQGLMLPLVYINDELFSSGGKINGPAIRRRIEVLTQASEV